MTRILPKEFVFFAIFFIGLLAFASFIVATPTGGTFDFGSSTSAPNGSPGSNGAYAGNVTGMTITANVNTPSWQGYFGNVSGTMRLANSAGNTMYNWSLANPSGEVYASVNTSIEWTNIQCFNFTADQSFADESGNGGTTNLNGVNLTGLHTRYGLSTTDADSVNNTFAFTVAADGHDAFVTASQAFSASECLHTKVYGDGPGQVANEFEEVLLYEPVSGSVVFASILETTATTGFNGAEQDFEMIVLEDGHGTDTSTTTYYFFVELE